MEENPAFGNITYHLYEARPLIVRSIVNPWLVILAIVITVFWTVLQTLSKIQKKSGLEGSDCEGLDAIPLIQPSIPIKLIGNVPFFCPLSKALARGMRWTTDPKYGDIMKFYGANQTFVLLHNPQMVQTLLKSSDPGHLSKSSLLYGLMKPHIINGLLPGTGPTWHKSRKVMLKTQSLQSLKSYTDMICRNSKQFVEEIEKLFDDGDIHEINSLINMIFIKIASELIGGENLDPFNSTEFEDYYHNFHLWMKVWSKRVSEPWLMLPMIWKMHPMYGKHVNAMDDMSNFARRRIQVNKAKRLKLYTNKEELKVMKFRSIMDEMINAGIVDEDHLVDEFNTLMYGSHDTSAPALHWLLFHLALDPELQEKCRNEVDEMFENTEHLTFETIQVGLKYMERCIQEVLRLYPPAFILFRELSSPLKLECEESNRRIQLPVGTTVVVFPYGMHRKPEYYPEPEKFDPDRFLPEEVAKRPTLSYFPFSFGPKNCPGSKFGMLQMKIVAADILRKFEILTVDKPEDVETLGLVMLMPSRNFRFRFIKRTLSNKMLPFNNW